VASPSEQISTRWIEGAVRECRQCGMKITNLAKQVGEVRSVYPGPHRDILCMDCHLGRAERLVERTRRELGLQDRPKSA
jgi:nitrate/TMAO reductase-like tetraheme cytochrome c subunit